MKKLLYLFIVSIVIASCGGDSNGTIIPEPEPEIKKPIAVNDNYAAIEDNELIISTLLSNDTNLDKARISSIDQTSADGASIVDNRNGSYSYLSKKAYVGTDTFKYTICDSNTPQNCSTATVTIIVSDEGDPVAVDDNYNSVKNTTRTFTDILDNDALTDDATINSVDNTNSTGTVTLNNDGSVTYDPQSNFTGEDTFTYSICDDDSPNQTCATATVTVTILESISFNIPTDLVSYYENLGLTSDANLNYTILGDFTTTQHTTILSYSQRHNYLYSADEDNANTDNVILMYSGESRYWEEYTSGTNSYTPQTFNTEHVYPQSKLSTDDAVTDLHHLRSCDDNVNSDRSNFPFVDGSGTYGVSNDQWFPGDEWRGDVARMIMYLNVRYGETFDKVGTLDLFLEWNAADPVSSFELQRNNVIESAQGNRNPFIDNPYLATLIWGGDAAENKWE